MNLWYMISKYREKKTYNVSLCSEIRVRFFPSTNYYIVVQLNSLSKIYRTFVYVPFITAQITKESPCVCILYTLNYLLYIVC